MKNLQQPTLSLFVLSVLTSLLVSCNWADKSQSDKSGFVITGQVVDSQLKPVEEVAIYTQTPQGKFTTNSQGSVERTGSLVETDQEGRYELTTLDSAATLEFIHPAYVTSVVPRNKIISNRPVQLFTKEEVIKLVSNK